MYMPRALRETTYKNRLLASLPAPAIKKLAPFLLPVQLPRDFTLHAAKEPVEYVYFPEAGICSTVAAVEDGETVEVGLVGSDGFVGVPVILGAGQSPHRAFMQIAGHGFRVPVRIVTRLADELAPLRICLLRSVQAQLVQTAQTAACNRIHELHERLARWLLLCHDRVNDHQIPITQEFLATMLGTRRSSVSVAAGTLQKAGLIAVTRGRVTILDYDGLIAASCECYEVVRAETVRLELMD
jgi:CRP-like cAMP-binding protein